MIPLRGKVIFSRDGETATYLLGDKEVTKEEYQASFPDKELGEPMGASPAIWPMESVALAVHPKQVQAANERNKLHGIMATYKEDGTCVIQDRNARKQLNKLERFFDKSGGYGD